MTRAEAAAEIMEAFDKHLAEAVAQERERCVAAVRALRLTPPYVESNHHFNTALDDAVDAITGA